MLAHQNYQKWTEVVVNIINNKAEFLMKKKYLITEMRSSALASVPLFFPLVAEDGTQNQY